MAIPWLTLTPTDPIIGQNDRPPWQPSPKMIKGSEPIKSAKTGIQPQFNPIWTDPEPIPNRSWKPFGVLASFYMPKNLAIFFRLQVNFFVDWVW